MLMGSKSAHIVKVLKWWEKKKEVADVCVLPEPPIFPQKNQPWNKLWNNPPEALFVNILLTSC